MVKRIMELLDRDQMFCLATVVASEHPSFLPGTKAIILSNGALEGEWGESHFAQFLLPPAVRAMKEKKRMLVEIVPGLTVFYDVLSRDARLLVCGAGHIAMPLAKLARVLGFSVTILDDRPDFAHISRFPECEIIADDFVPALRRLSVDSSCYVVVITRGHEHDAECLQEILAKENEAAYVGLIGSRRRVRFVLDMLGQGGIRRERLEKVFTPIGLPIGAESPEEIALSILAEIVCVRKKQAVQARVLREAGRGMP
jgi:xanthine dehydrogenase accessory factor